MKIWCYFNPNTFAGLVGKVRKKLSPEGGRKGGWRKKAHAARPPDPELEPGTCHVLGEGPQLHASGVQMHASRVQKSKPFRAHR